MKKDNSLYILVLSAMLCAIGIIIPMFSPFKILLEPASFTLGSHIAIFIAMFVSPVCALAVAIGTTFGFFLGGFPIVIVMRAATHVIFALIGALVIRKRPSVLEKPVEIAVFAVLISIIHGLCELLVVIPFYFGNQLTGGYYAKGFVTTVVLLVGVGSVVHSLIDFTLARVIWAPLKKISRDRLMTAPQTR